MLFSVLGNLAVAAVETDRSSPLGVRTKLACKQRGAILGAYFDGFMGSFYPEKYAADAEWTAVGGLLGKALVESAAKAHQGSV